MSSICVGDLKYILNSIPDEYEVIMNIRHSYDIPKEDGVKGWIAYIYGINKDDNLKEVRLMN